MLRTKYKSRCICKKPEYRAFIPECADEDCPVIGMTFDEYEAVRLIDLEGFSQETCAGRMGISRTTVQAMYAAARKKIAMVLVYGARLVIDGGNYNLCEGKNPACFACRHEIREEQFRRLTKKEKNLMRIAVTYENGEVFQHFGRTETFKVYDVADGKIVSGGLIAAGGKGHGALAGVLSDAQADVLICGGIGGGAQTALANAGVALCAGASGNADAAVSAYLEGKLVHTGSNCNHHHHEEGHACGDHGCHH